MERRSASRSSEEPRDARDRSTRRALLRALGGGGVAALAGVAGCLGGTAGDDRRTDRTTDDGSGGDPGGTTDGESDGTTDDGTGEEIDPPAYARWTFRTGRGALGALTLAPGPDGPAVYAGTAEDDGGGGGDGHSLHALGLPDGDEEWRLDLPHAVRRGPLYGGDDGPERLYFATGPESLHGRDVVLRAADPSAGSEVWTFDSEDRRFLHPLASSDDAVFVGRMDDQVGREGEFLYALEAGNGDERWRVAAGDARTRGHAARRGTAFLATRGRLQVLDAASGDRRWAFEADRNLQGPAYDDRGERVFVGDDGVVTGRAVEDGARLWRREFEFTVSTVTTPRAAMDGTVFVGDYGGRLIAVDPLEGDTRWTLDVDGDGDGFYPGVARTSERLFASGAGVHAVDPVSGDREWSFGTDRPGSFGASVGTTVFAKSGVENAVYALDPATGDERWRFAPERRIEGLATAGDTAFVGVGGTVLALDGSEPA